MRQILALLSILTTLTGGYASADRSLTCESTNLYSNYSEIKVITSHDDAGGEYVQSASAVVNGKKYELEEIKSGNYEIAATNKETGLTVVFTASLLINTTSSDVERLVCIPNKF